METKVVYIYKLLVIMRKAPWYWEGAGGTRLHGLCWSSKSRWPMPFAVANEDRPDSRFIFMATGPEFGSLKVYAVV